MTIALVIFALMFMSLVGYSIIKSFDLIPKLSDVEILPFSFGLGAGLMAFQFYFYSRLGIEWNNLIIILPWILFILFSIYFKKLNFKLKINRKEIGNFSFILILLILGLILFTFFESILRPVPAWDGFASWQMRSKMFFLEGGLDKNIFQYIPSEYPELVSLMTVYIYKIIGFIDDRNSLLLYPTFYLSVGLIFFFAIKKKLSTTLSLFFTFLLLSTQNLIRHSGRFEVGQADVILGFYIFASVILLLYFIKNKNFGTLILLQAYLIITTLIKNEGVSVVIVMQIILMIFIFKNKLFKMFPMFLIWIFPFIEWQYFKSSLDLGKYPSYFENVIHIERITLIFKNYFKELFNFQNWNFAWITYLYSTFLFIIYLRKYRELLLINLIILSQLLIYGFIFIFTSPDPNIHIPNVLNRAFLHLLPLAIFSIALVFDQLNLISFLKFKHYERK